MAGHSWRMSLCPTGLRQRFSERISKYYIRFLQVHESFFLSVSLADLSCGPTGGKLAAWLLSPNRDENPEVYEVY